MPVHPFAHAELATLGEQAGLIELGDEVVEVVIRFEDHVATTSTIATFGLPLGR